MSNRQIKLKKLNPTHAQYNKPFNQQISKHTTIDKFLNFKPNNLTSLEANTKSSESKWLNGTVIPTW
jgi:hypothetical protein